jgi:desulfoferrodoxin (superoxide reductase-like protein)
MKIGKYIVIIMLLISTAPLAMPVLAHPPQDMTLAYDLDISTLSVTIAHETPAPNAHYVYKVDIKVNDELIISEEYTSQPTNNIFTYEYVFSAEIGDIITVTAYCNIQGSITRSITVSDPSQDDPPVVEIKNPVQGYFHFSGIRIFATYINLVYDTMGFGGFRLRPVQVYTEDDIDASEDLIVKIYIDDELRDTAVYNPDNGFHELKWTGPRLGVFTLKATAEDSQGNIGSDEMDVWYFCFIPE